MESFTNEKDDFIKFLSTKDDIPLFLSLNWINVVKNHYDWDVILTKDNNEIVAFFVFVYSGKGLFKSCTQPDLSQYFGLWIDYSGKCNTPYKKVSHEKKIISNIVQQLNILCKKNKVSFFKLNLETRYTNWLPFFWKGFSQSSRYTYVLNNLQMIEKVESVFTSSKRRDLKKAKSLVEIKTGLTRDIFFEHNQKTFMRRKIAVPFSRNFFNNLYDNAIKNGFGKDFYSIDKNNEIHGVVFIVWDKESSYLILLGEDETFRSSQSGILLIYEAIQYTKNVLGLNHFNFEGSMIESVEQIYRHLGGEQVMYHSISNVYSKMFYFLKSIKNLLKQSK